MRRTTSRPEVNAGSMADIAFLLLIFFLVTAAIPKDDQGFNRKLPEKCPMGIDCSAPIPDRNILKIAINSKNEIMVEEEVTAIVNIKDIAKRFLDNNGKGTCNYCNGDKLSTSSDHPKKAVISLKSDRETSYGEFIKVQDELTKAYYELREKYILNTLKKRPDNLTKKELEKVKNAYPFILSEAEIQ